MTETQRYYDDFALRYDEGRDRGYHAMVDRLELDTVLPLAREKDVLEVGCGTGRILAPLHEASRSAIGIDTSTGMLDGARERGLNVVRASATALPFADASFDLVCSFKVLAHVTEIDRALAEISRVTRPGGRVVVELYNRWSLRHLAKSIAGAQKIGMAHKESDIPTRWDSPFEAVARMPSELELLDERGIRVFTPAAFVHRIPFVGPSVRRLERWAADSPLWAFGGFLVLTLRKRDKA